MARSQPQTAANMERFFALSSEMFLIAGYDGTFRFINGAWEKILGYPIDELVGKPYIDFVHPDDRDRTRAEAARLQERASETIEFENRYLRKDGSYIWLCWNARSDAQARLLYCVARDITERKRSEAALRAARDEMERRVKERTEELAKANEAIREVSTPVLSVTPGLLIVPMIGAVDAQRARQLTEQLLRAIRSHRAKAAVVDVTGMVSIDTAVANHLMQTARACKLLGADVILTGISRDIALTLVELGVELKDIVTKGDLQSGIEEAMNLIGLQIELQEKGPEEPKPLSAAGQSKRNNGAASSGEATG